jgi:hypothetical protein
LNIGFIKSLSAAFSLLLFPCASLLLLGAGAGEKFSQCGLQGGSWGFGWASGGKFDGAKLGGEPDNSRLWGLLKTQ